jgi:hypothetical protein
MLVGISIARQLTAIFLPTINSITLNGSAMTPVVSANNSSLVSTYLYYYINPRPAPPV